MIMLVDLTAAGLAQGQLWSSGAPWMDSVRVSHGYWLVRAASAVPILAGFAVFIAGLFAGASHRNTSGSQPLPNTGAQLAQANHG
jgi:hypothetical protein